MQSQASVTPSARRASLSYLEADMAPTQRPVDVARAPLPNRFQQLWQAGKTQSAIVEALCRSCGLLQ